MPLTTHRLIHAVTESAKFRATWNGLAPYAARLALASPDIEEPFAGIAWLAVADHAEAEERWGDAMDAYQLAARSLLRQVDGDIDFARLARVRGEGRAAVAEESPGLVPSGKIAAGNPGQKVGNQTLAS